MGNKLSHLKVRVLLPHPRRTRKRPTNIDSDDENGLFINRPVGGEVDGVAGLEPAHTRIKT